MWAKYLLSFAAAVAIVTADEDLSQYALTDVSQHNQSEKSHTHDYT